MPRPAPGHRRLQAQRLTVIPATGSPAIWPIYARATIFPACLLWNAAPASWRCPSTGP